MPKDALITVDDRQIKEFAKALQRYGKSRAFEKEIGVFFEGVGMEFLRIVSEEIVRRNVVDTRLLLNSFHKGGKSNIWETSSGGMSLTVGTNVEYAIFANDGHWTNSKGVQVRFVPGVWNGDTFTYQPGAKTGMVLKQHWVEGAHYWEGAIRIMESMFPRLLEKKLADWAARFARGGFGVRRA